MEPIQYFNFAKKNHAHQILIDIFSENISIGKNELQDVGSNTL